MKLFQTVDRTNQRSARVNGFAVDGKTCIQSIINVGLSIAIAIVYRRQHPFAD